MSTEDGGCRGQVPDAVLGRGDLFLHPFLLGPSRAPLLFAILALVFVINLLYLIFDDFLIFCVEINNLCLGIRSFVCFCRHNVIIGIALLDVGAVHFRFGLVHLRGILDGRSLSKNLIQPSADTGLLSCTIIRRPCRRLHCITNLRFLGILSSRHLSLIGSRGGRDINRKHNALTLGSEQSWGSLGQVYKIVEKTLRQRSIVR